MTCRRSLDRTVSGGPAMAWRYLRHSLALAAWAWLPRSWATEWFVLLGLMLADLLPRVLPVVAVVVRHG